MRARYLFTIFIFLFSVSVAGATDEQSLVDNAIWSPECDCVPCEECTPEVIYVTSTAECPPNVVVIPLGGKTKCPVCPACPVDSDSDGVLDGFDRCPGFDDLTDTDRDSVADGCDACPGFADYVKEDFFTGQYLMEQLSGVDPLFAAETFGDTQIVNITSSGNIRSFNFLYYPGIFNSDYNFQMTLECGEIYVHGEINAGGLGCGGANIGFSTGVPVSTYDKSFCSSDDIIFVNVTDFDPDGNCGTGSYQVELRFTKQP